MIGEFGRRAPGGELTSRYDALGFEGSRWCQGAVQGMELVPKTEVGAEAKLSRGEGPLQDNRRKHFGSGAGSGADSSRQLRKFRFRDRVFGVATSVSQLPKFRFRKWAFAEVKGHRRSGINRRLGSSQDVCEARRARIRAQVRAWIRGVLTCGNAEGLGTAVIAPHTLRSSRNSDAGSTPVTRR